MQIMIKTTGLNIKGFHNTLVMPFNELGWVLCIGAGTSLEIFGSWETLAQKFINIPNNNIFNHIKSQLTPDSIIQSKRNRSTQSDRKFAENLSKIFYGHLKNKFSKKEWLNISNALSAISPPQLNKPYSWDNYLNIIRTNFPNLSALQIANAVYNSIRFNCPSDKIGYGPIAPSAILTFNAEPLLYSLITALAATDPTLTIKYKDRRFIDRITRGVSHHRQDRIPYIYCHGLLPVLDGMRIMYRSLSATKLVFSESEYLDMTNSSFSWASSMFINSAIFHRIVFIGFSFRDPNLRRWLYWVRSNKIKELLEIAGKNRQFIRQLRTNKVYGHYWINKVPRKKWEQKLIEDSVEHLGVKLVWIDEWSEIETCLKSGLGI